MEKIEFHQLQEELYYEQLDNGLKVYILPKRGFHKTFATFTTKYGSIDNHFIPLGKTDYTLVPDGIAHFLEHKLFEKEDGDVFQQFSKQGASANAFTSFTRTSYLFSATENVEQNLKTLIDFVQEPYFSEATVEKEKGIIGQEIQMYNDNPDWRNYFGAISNMYHNHPVKIDIAGTIDSIAKITKDMLYECYHTFYHPSNMLLFIVGPVLPDDLMEKIKANQKAKSFPEPVKIQRKYPEEPLAVAKKSSVIPMNVQTPKCIVGVKSGFTGEKRNEMLKTELTIQLLLDMLFSQSSVNYRDLYDEGIIDDTFSYDYTQEQSFGFALIGGDTQNPDLLANRIKAILQKAASGENLSEESLERVKKRRIGTFLRSLNSPEFIANQFTRYKFNEMNLFKAVPVLETISFKDVKAKARDFIKEEAITYCQVVPKNT